MAKRSEPTKYLKIYVSEHQRSWDQNLP
jgi:hypothetical protein